MAFKDEIALSFVSTEEPLFEDSLDASVWDPDLVHEDPESPWVCPEPEVLEESPFPHEWMDTVEEHPDGDVDADADAADTAYDEEDASLENVVPTPYPFCRLSETMAADAFSVDSGEDDFLAHFEHANLNSDPMWNSFCKLEDGYDVDGGMLDLFAPSSRDCDHDDPNASPDPSRERELFQTENGSEVKIEPGDFLTDPEDPVEDGGVDDSLLGADFFTLGTSWNNQIGDGFSFNQRLTSRSQSKRNTLSQVSNVAAKSSSESRSLQSKCQRSMASGPPLLDTMFIPTDGQSNEPIEFYMLQDAGVIKLNSPPDLSTMKGKSFKQKAKTKKSNNNPDGQGSLQPTKKCRVKQTKGLSYREFRDLQNRAERIRRYNHRCLFLHLRMLLPGMGDTKKKTKLSTLTDALGYCQYLQQKNTRLWNSLWLELSRQMELKQILEHYNEAFNSLRCVKKERS